MVKISKGSRQHPSRKLSVSQIALTVVLCGVSFYSGALSGMGGMEAKCDPLITSTEKKTIREPEQNAVVDDAKIEAIVRQRVEAELSKAGGSSASSTTKESHYFTKSTSAYLNGVARVPKDAFVQTYDYGPPMEAANDKNGEVILLYNTPKALPSDETQRHMVQYDTGYGMPMLDVKDATENCDSMNVINTSNPGGTRQCLAIVGNYESYHVQRWMRLPTKNGQKLDSSVPLRAVSRGHGSNGARQFVPPSAVNIKKHWGMLQRYFDSLDSVLKELKPIAEKVAVDNTIIVMTCNMGQSELLINFVCNARAKGFLDLNNFLIFPTDKDTKELAESLGLATFYDEKNFEDMPEAEAGHYGDKAFVAMMFAKVVCVQLVNHLGYDLLFQDVDIVWYKNPIEYFHDDQNPHRDFDMYFQDDGAHSTRYAPLSANSGFYYVRNNERTRYLFTSLLYHGDQILESHSHQEALVQVMNEHTSLFGLRVKVLSRDMDEFPGGWHYHRRNKEFMMKVVKEEVSPIIFHMSWTKNKDNKIKFLQQMGQWYVNDSCIAHTKSEIVGNLDLSAEEPLFEPCCLSEPNIICHYRDKPSKIPCRDVDPIDAGRPSFW